MKRMSTHYLFIIIALVAIITLFSGIAEANLWDSAKNIGGGIGLTAIALIATGLIAIGGLATRAVWMSVLLMAIGTFISNIGLMLQDKKIDKDELKRAKQDFARIKAAIKGKL